MCQHTNCCAWRCTNADCQNLQWPHEQHSADLVPKFPRSQPRQALLGWAHTDTHTDLRCVLLVTLGWAPHYEVVVLNLWLIDVDKTWGKVKKPAKKYNLLGVGDSEELCNMALMDRVPSDSKQLHHFLHNDSYPLIPRFRLLFTQCIFPSRLFT